MVPIVSIVGRSGSGKTTLIERLLPVLAARGLRVATVKHHRHRSPVDVPGKDSWRHARAGARAVVVAGATELALFRPTDGPPDLMRIVREFLGDMDLVVTEGFKAGPTPKIEVTRATQGLDLLSGPADNLIAVVSDRPLAVEVPVFGLEDLESLAAVITMRVLRTEAAKPEAAPVSNGAGGRPWSRP